MSKKILITGGTGFIGHHLAKKCLKFNWSVTSLSTKKPSKQRKLNKVKYKTCDLFNDKKIKKILSLDYDYVVNLAGYVDHSNKSKLCEAIIMAVRKFQSIFKIKYSKVYSSRIKHRIWKNKIPQIRRKRTNKKLFLHMGKLNY